MFTNRLYKQSPILEVSIIKGVIGAVRVKFNQRFWEWFWRRFWKLIYPKPCENRDPLWPTHFEKIFSQEFRGFHLSPTSPFKWKTLYFCGCTWNLSSHHPRRCPMHWALGDRPRGLLTGSFAICTLGTAVEPPSFFGFFGSSGFVG
jgi:hypothetical protein